MTRVLPATGLFAGGSTAGGRWAKTQRLFPHGTCGAAHAILVRALERILRRAGGAQPEAIHLEQAAAMVRAGAVA
ncbi:MAG: hypothetical protein ACLS8R_02760 [Anaeromassilibacillus sp.]